MGVKKFKDRPDSMTDLKGYRKYYTDRGLCPHCKEHRELAPGRRMCRVCLDKYQRIQQELRRKRENSRLCIACGKPLPDGTVRKFCQPCVEKDNQVTKKNRQARIDAGRCVACGASLGRQDVKPDGSYYRRCFKCRIRVLEYERARRAKKKEAAEREVV